MIQDHKSEVNTLKHNVLDMKRKKMGNSDEEKQKNETKSY